MVTSKDHQDEPPDHPTSESSDNQAQIDACLEEVHRLQEENRYLRASAHAFGELAERLNDAMERRAGQDRRVRARPTPDRRTRRG